LHEGCRETFFFVRLLTWAETAEYMQHRMRVASASQFPFDPQALDAVYEISRGNLRAIDQLARKSLELAAQRNIPAVDAAMVAAARHNLLL
jgi:type II secretory pathway predicted ATPase ExeA